MKSEWRVSSNYVDGKKYFGVYRLLDVDAVDHSGNRESAGCGLLESREDAAFIAEQLNLNEEGKENERKKRGSEQPV